MSAHGLVRVTGWQFDEVVCRRRLYPIIKEGSENWIDERGHVIAKRVASERAVYLVMAAAADERHVEHKAWEDD